MEGSTGGAALVTGASRRLGRRIAERLAAAGHPVVLHCNTRRGDAEDAEHAIRDAGGRAWVVQAELGAPDAPARLFAQARRACGGPVAVLVNNASTYPASTWDTMAWTDLEESLHVNAWAPIALMQAWSAQDDLDGDASCVNLLDARMVDRDRDHAAYLLCKNLLAEATRQAAVEWAPRCRVNGVAPGPVLPPAGKDETYLNALRDRLPLQRTPTPDEVADAVLYLARARSVTGQTLFVDGGRHLRRGRT